VSRIQSETAVGLFVLFALAIFFYMSIQLGVLRFNKASYNSYTLYFSDIAGLNKKADVKIAGIKVGWIETLELLHEQQLVRVTLAINKECLIHDDASATIRQEGLLGTKFLELIPGNYNTPLIPHGGTISRKGKESASFDHVVGQLKDVVQHVEHITTAFKETMTHGNTNQLHELLASFAEAVRHVSSFSERLDGLLEHNTTAIETTLSLLKELAIDLKKQIPSLNNDFTQVVNKIDATTNSIAHIMNKFDEGKGFIGQLIHDDTTYHNLRVTAQGLKNYFTKFDRLSIVFDSHLELMHGPFQYEWFKDAKGYFDIRFHPAEDYFYIAGIVGTLSGTIHRYELHRRWFENNNSECNELLPDNLILTDAERLRFAPLKQKIVRSFDMPTFNLEFGKIYRNIAVRFGIIESTIGVGLDIEIPFSDERFRWVTTFEIFDFRGRKRFDDDHPHLKWLNRMFMTQNIYMVFGADDFISKNNKNTFFGVGLRFGDDEIKYLFPQVNVSV
jgi:phospholipid/cholesterol/gamma-HCH transport system substrate-binding protein